jgi:murein DD-endopeptidase MepM/ murein hydrolase activator NlpD
VTVSEPLNIDTARAIGQLSPETAVPAETPVRLKQLAEQFESLLMTQMLREMRASMFDDDKDTGFASGPLSDALFGELSLALSRAGGLGLGQSLVAPLARQAGTALSRGEDSESSLEAGATSTAGPQALSAGAAASGGGTPLALRKDGQHLNPIAGPISSAFGWRRDPLDGTMKFHKGIDVAVPAGTDVASARDGAVTFAGPMHGYGLTVVVDHGDGLATRYAHLSEITVAVGDVVREGQRLARSGATGRVTGAHLHFEVLSDGQPVDPGAK